MYEVYDNAGNAASRISKMDDIADSRVIKELGGAGHIDDAEDILSAAKRLDVSGGGLKVDDYVRVNEGGLEPGTLSNVDARKWYLEQEAKISDLIDDSLPLEQQAKQAFDLRNQYRTQARELMSDRQLAESLYITEPNLTWGK